MNNAAWGWITAAVGTILLAAIVVFGLLEDDRERRQRGLRSHLPARPTLDGIPRHARPTTRLRIARRLVATYSSAMFAALLTALGRVTRPAKKAAGRASRAIVRLARRPATYPAAAAIGLVAAFVLAGLPGVGSVGDDTPGAALPPAQAQPAEPSVSSPSDSPSPTEPTPTSSSSRGGTPAPVSGGLASAPRSSDPDRTPDHDDAPDEGAPDPGPPPMPEPEPDETPEPTSEPSPTFTSTRAPLPQPTPTDPPDDDDDDGCLIGLLDLCLIGSD